MRAARSCSEEFGRKNRKEKRLGRTKAAVEAAGRDTSRPRVENILVELLAWRLRC